MRSRHSFTYAATRSTTATPRWFIATIPGYDSCQGVQTKGAAAAAAAAAASAAIKLLRHHHCTQAGTIPAADTMLGTRWHCLACVLVHVGQLISVRPPPSMHDNARERARVMEGALRESPRTKPRTTIAEGYPVLRSPRTSSIELIEQSIERDQGNYGVIGQGQNVPGAVNQPLRASDGGWWFCGAGNDESL